ncbi:hypothetical protein PUN28_016118 [Cardiocondyla obscurior]|uniref:Uncharacterized protein n=1 Tax=Cardiocondyla obscurior TaxID=286306 RepID=A0AAW2EUQ3_9HYME
MIQHQFFLLIHIIYCAVTIHGILLNANDAETCNLLCVQCNASAVFANNECECNFAENSDKDLDMECMQRVQSELQDIEQNMLYEDLTDEERNARSISRYNRRLRHGDAEKVAQYFINGGPAAGHSHFIRAFNAAYDNQPATSSFSGIDESNPENEFRSVSLTSPSTSSNTYDSPLHMVPEYGPRASKTMQNKWMYIPMSPGIVYPTHEEYDPHMMNSIIRPNKLPLYRIAFTPVTIPDYGIHQMLYPHVYHSEYQRGLLRSSNVSN